MKKIKSIFIVSILIFTSITLSFIGNAEKLKIENNQIELSGSNQNLTLIRGEHYLYIDGNENVSLFNIKYAFPPEYGHQYPIYLDIIEDTDANITNYKIENDTLEPNKIINFTISEIKKSARLLIHFNCWVLIKNYDFEDLPDFIEIPSVDDLPEYTKKWLSPTDVVQSDNILIKFRAKLLKLFTNNNILKLAEKTARFCYYNRFLNTNKQYLLQGIFQYPPQDALTSLIIGNRECPGRSHLGCSLFRANNIPARVVLGMPTRYYSNFDAWFEMHYMTEYYCPGFDWILTEVHAGHTPYPPQEQMIIRICYPEDENDTQVDFMFPRMKGIERWIWIDNEYIKPYYKDCVEGSKSRSYPEGSISIDKNTADQSINLTSNVFNKYKQLLNANLTGENLTDFEAGKQYIENAISELSSSDDAFGYIYYLNKANDHFDSIII